MRKKFLSITLALCLAFTLALTTVAADTTNTENAYEYYFYNEYDKDIEALTDIQAEEPEPVPVLNLATASHWAYADIIRAFDIGLIPVHLQSEFTQPITRAEFAALVVALYEVATGREITVYMEFYDTDDINVQKVGGLGVITGVGEGNFAPDSALTREQAAVMISRLADAIGRPLPQYPPFFADNIRISSWAFSAVGQVQAAGIMGGVGNNNFVPNGSYTREQSIITMVRLIRPDARLEILPIQPAPPVNIPIFMYHTSSEHNPGPLSSLYVRPSEFERQIRHLYENGFTFVTFDDWHNLHNIERPVMITFDDGYAANYTEIFPILQRYNARIVIFLTLSNLYTSGLTTDMVRRMHDSGLVQFEAHSITHRSLPGLSDAALTRELRDARDMIENITNRPVVAAAWPGGDSNARVREFARRYYQFGINASGGMHNTGIDDFQIRRFRVSRGTTMTQFINMLG